MLQKIFIFLIASISFGFKPLERIDSPDEWFEVYKPTNGVYAIYEPYDSEEVISFLILGNSCALLFDTGMGIGDIKKVVESITSLPIFVVNSHNHYDHVGGNWQFDQVLKLNNEETIELGGRILEIMATPGHTPDSICLLDRENGLLFTGDTYYPATIWLHCPETDLEAYVHSIEQLTRLVPKLKLLLTSHNRPIAEPSDLLGLLVAIRKVQAKEVSPAPFQGKLKYFVDGFSFLISNNGF